MINSVLEAIGITFITIFILSGSGFILWWAIESVKRDCCKNKSKKKLKR